jgi:uncharacterized repeat protein (TIGR01451 family)
MAGTNSTFSLTVSNHGPLAATNVVVTFALPTNAQFVAAGGCLLIAATVTCNVGSLTANASRSFSITVHWTSSGPFSTTAAIAADQNNSTPLQQTVQFGTPAVGEDAADGGDAPLPWWAWLVTALLLLSIAEARGRSVTRRQMPALHARG